MLAAVGFVWGRIRADIVALMALLILTLSGILITQEAVSGFSRIIMMVEECIAGNTDGSVGNRGGDILFIRGPRGNVDRFVSDYGLRVADDDDGSRRHPDFYDIGLAEIVILPNSGTLRETIVRNRYNVDILGVRRGGEYITDNLGERQVANGYVLHAAQCPGDAALPIHVYGLCEGGRAAAAPAGDIDDNGHPCVLPVLIDIGLCSCQTELRKLIGITGILLYLQIFV